MKILLINYENILKDCLLFIIVRLRSILAVLFLFLPLFLHFSNNNLNISGRGGGGEPTEPPLPIKYALEPICKTNTI